ncbi:glycosyltransferase family 4 protein [Caenimonas aquaedulcis]|uniref:Glycosyltransferase family 4 protein n=1 Tax=Caenimonas aquaedulcis TaxID=2793270 RepID=A0A931H6X7_9BURK|nr:glycosyltransferase family 4 protein [Caenimonas aquaedulcis]MBG9389789.1 glycosyltransferase family 4 protein [Caenimonas aquaedulcis]
MTDKTTAEAPAQDAPATAAPPAPDNRPSILFAAPMNILDITSGAALSMRTLLSGLAGRGYRAIALQASLFDSEQGAEHVIEAGAGEAVKDKQILRSMVLGVEHLIVRTKGVRRPDMTSAEEEIYIRKFREELQLRRPDCVILWGGLLLEMTIMREAREAGIPVVFYLVNAGYKNKDNFRYVSVIVTDTEATAALYKERLGLVCHPIGKFIDPKLVKAEERKPEFITFINPSFEKGVNVFMPLAKLAAKEAPEIKFLVVQSRGRWGIALKVLKFEPGDFPNVRVIGHQRNMRPVYGATKALLLPSVWHESGARVIAEAMINGIPVIASNTGGSAELVGKGGVVFEFPDIVKDKRDLPATEEVVRPWLEEIKRIWHDPAYFAELTERVAHEAKQHDIQRNLDRFAKAVGPAIAQSKQWMAARAQAAQGAKAAPAAGDMKSAVKQALAKKQQRTAKRK